MYNVYDAIEIMSAEELYEAKMWYEMQEEDPVDQYNEYGEEWE